MLKNIFLLAICQALMMSATSLAMTSSALVGLEIAPSERLATLPLALCYVTNMLMLIPGSLFMQRYGRRAGFSAGAIGGILAGIIGGVGIYTHDFVLFCISAIFLGIAMSSGQFYRFAAVEVAAEDFKSRAISWVLAGGLVAAFLGPSIALFTRDTFSGPAFSASFGCVAILGLGVLLCQFFLHIPTVKIEQHHAPKRPLMRILRTPAFIVAVLCAMVAYGSMNLLMISTPLAMNHLDLSFDSIAMVIQWHIVGMFAPSFFTGSLIHRFGVLKIMFAGVLMLFGCVFISFHGHGFAHFLGALIALGIGWNFLHVGGTTLLTEVYRPAEKGTIQGINEFLVFIVVAFTALGSGYLHHTVGWIKLNLFTIPAMVIVSLGIFALYIYNLKNRTVSKVQANL